MVVIWEPMALSDFEYQYQWYQLNMGNSAARKFRKGIFADAALLAHNPMLGKLEEDINEAFGEHGWRSIISGRKYRIIYCVEEDVLKIYMIWACLRDKKKLDRIIKKEK